MPNELYINMPDIIQATEQISAQYYSDTDLTSLGGQTNGYMLSPVFGKSPFDRVEYHVYDPNYTRLFSNHNTTNCTVDTDIIVCLKLILRLRRI